MEGDACTWALPHLKLLSKGTVPFTGSWDKFIAEFTKWFILLDISEAAQEALKKIWQGKDSIAEYTSKFNQYTTQTGWSDADHHQRFYNGLNDKIKDMLSYMDQPIATLTQLHKAVSKVDRRIHQHESEKCRGQQNSGAARDPDTMQVDTLWQQQQQPAKNQKTKVEYMKFMQGKCFGCGLKEHTKKDGHHERDVCNHCGKTGHRSPVCFTKYMGKPGKLASATATSDSTSSTTTSQTSPPSSSTSVSATASAKDNKTQADLLAQLMKHIEAQDVQIKVLSASF